MKKSISVLALAAALAAGLSGCAQTPQNRQIEGEIMGGVAGAAVGSLIGGGTGKIIATGAGAVLGSIAGAKIANPQAKF